MTELKSSNLILTACNDRLTIKTVFGEELISGSPNLFIPALDGNTLVPEKIHIKRDRDSLLFVYTYAEDAPIRCSETLVRMRRGYLSFSSSFTAARECMLERINLFKEGTKLSLYKLLNFRNHHCTEHTYPDLAIGQSFETTTFSNDWQFSPHPSMFVFTKNTGSLLLGALTLPKTFGLYINIDHYTVCSLYEDYGNMPCGLKLQSGERFESTEYALFFDPQPNPLDTIRQYTHHLVAGGYVPDPAQRKTHSWHRDNLYCTWIDQGYLSECVIPTQLHNQIEITLSATMSLTQDMVMQAVDVIEREKLPLKTILIDMGWADRGEWIADPKRFPDFRGMVDELHRRGYRAVIWWNWAENSDTAYIDPRFLANGGKLNKHGQRTIDFSHPVTQEEYLKPLFRRLFSSEPGCYDLDGCKTDFLSDKIHPELDIYDPAWRGEERYFYNIFAMFFNLMRSHKPDAVHIGCAGHPYLAEFIDINRTYDVWSTNVLEHVNRGEMLKVSTMDTPVAYDFHHYLENLEEYFQKAYENNCSVQIGNVLGVKPTAVSGWEPVDDKYFELLRTYLPMLPRR